MHVPHASDRPTGPQDAWCLLLMLLVPLVIDRIQPRLPEVPICVPEYRGLQILMQYTTHAPGA
jgi:hypothetical protein